MPSRWDRWALTAATAGVWLPGLFLLRYFAHFVSGRNGSGTSAFVGFAGAVLLCLLLLRLVWWLPYRRARAWVWTSVVAVCLCGSAVWVGTALESSVTAEIGNDMLWSAVVGLGTGAPVAMAYGAFGGFLIGLAARAGGAQAGPSERPIALAMACAFLLLAGTAGVVYFILNDTWPGPS